MSTAGLVYFVQAGDERGAIKIGRTTNFYARLSSMQSGCPLRLRALLTLSQPNVHSLERAFHALFADLRIDGLEWFAWHPDLQRAVDYWKAASDDIKTGKEVIEQIDRVHSDGAIQVETVTGLAACPGMNWRLRDELLRKERA